MITLVNLKESINNLIKSMGYRVYGNEIKKGFLRPSFFVQILPVGGTDLYKSHLYKNSYMVEINYFSKEQTDLANYNMADNLKEKLFPILKVKDRKLVPKEFKAEINDGVLSIRFNLKWLDAIARKEYEKVKELEIEMRD